MAKKNNTQPNETTTEHWMVSTKMPNNQITLYSICEFSMQKMKTEIQKRETTLTFEVVAKGSIRGNLCYMWWDEQIVPWKSNKHFNASSHAHPYLDTWFLCFVATKQCN